MGIQCVENPDGTITVIATNDHQRDVVTKSPKLPFFERREGYFLHSAFIRIGGNREFGSDGNPLVYAIKGLKNFYIGPGSCDLLHEELARNFRAIAERVRAFGETPFIFHTPSASPLPRFLACRFQRAMGVGKCSIFDVFEKQTYQDVLAECLRRKTASLKGSDEWETMTQVISEVNRVGKFVPKEPFRMKDLSMSLRKHVNPFKMKANTVLPEGVAGARAVVIEDTIGSGQSSACMAEMLRNAGATEVVVVSAFSPVQPISNLKRNEAKVEIVRKRRRFRQT